MEGDRLLQTRMERDRQLKVATYNAVQNWSDAAPGSREVREFVCFRFGLRELGEFSLRQREQGVSRPELKKFDCSRL